MGNAPVVDTAPGSDVASARHWASRTANGRRRRGERASRRSTAHGPAPLGDGGPSEPRLHRRGEPLARRGHVGPRRRCRRRACDASVERSDELLEDVAAVLEVVEHVERRAGRREQDDVAAAGLARAPRRSPPASWPPRSTGMPAAASAAPICGPSSPISDRVARRARARPRRAAPKSWPLPLPPAISTTRSSKLSSALIVEATLVPLESL